MLNHADISHFEKRSTVLFCVLNRKTRVIELQMVGPLSEKSQNILLPRDTKQQGHDSLQEFEEGVC